MQKKFTSILVLFAAMLVNISAFAQGGVTHFVSISKQITDLNDLSEDKYYVLKHVGQGIYQASDGTGIIAQTNLDYSCIVRLLYSGENLRIQQVSTGTYYQGLTAGSRVTLGSDAADYTIENPSEGIFRLRNNNCYIHRNNSNPIGTGLANSGPLSQWTIWQVDLLEAYSPFVNPKRITDVNDLSEFDYYILKNYGNQKYICNTSVEDNSLGLKDSPDYSCVVRLIYKNSTLHIQQVNSGTYFQGLTTNALTLGNEAVDYTFNTNDVFADCFRLANNNLYLNRNGGNTYPVGYTGQGEYSQWEIYKVSNTLPLNEDEIVAGTIGFNNGGKYNVALTRNFVKGFNTVVLPFDLNAEQVKTVFGEDVEVYTYSEESTDENNVTVTFSPNTEKTITANTPVLVKTTKESSESVTLKDVTIVYNENPVVTGNFFDFTGVYAAQTIDEGDYFVNEHLYKSNGNVSIKPFRAYLKAHEGANMANVKLMIGGAVTGIDSIDNANTTEGEIVYNLLGQRVNKAQKGIYIVNGKKVLVK